MKGSKLSTVQKFYQDISVETLFTHKSLGEPTYFPA